MPILKKTKGEIPAKVYGMQGMVVNFDADGLAEVEEATAKFFIQVDGYELAKVDEELSVTLEDFAKLSWQKQKFMVEKGEVPVEILEAIVAEGSEFKDGVKKPAIEALSKLQQ